jgi:tetratricopeptide (TPR) repeat protein
MSEPVGQPGARRPFVRRKWRLFLVLTVSVVALVIGGRQAWAWHQLRSARAELARYHPEVARRHLGRCLAVWPGSVEARLLASRAARQSGDFTEADRQLRAGQRALGGGTSAEVALEWALLQAASGNLREVEDYLQRVTERSPGEAPLVWEALVEGYVRVYRSLDALACLDYWLGQDPDNLRALELRGVAFQNAHSAQRGAENFRLVIERDPERDETRLRLAQCLLSMGGYEEALPHLERLAGRRPDSADVQVGLARCHNMRGQPERARELLDAFLERHPEHGLALRTRGQFALADGQPDQAERWLRHAAEVLPNDYLSHFLLGRALQEQRKTAEAKAQLALADEIKARAERLGELTSRKLSEQPLDPALHCEMGVLLLRNGHKSTGESWLKSALSLDPSYKPAHAALAEFYQAQGDEGQAAEHRRQAERANAP